MDDDGPRILRPVPRRPFESNQSNASPLPDDFMNLHDTIIPSRNQSGMDLSGSRFLNTNLERVDSTPSLTRPQSFLNLTSSTLMGIYSEAASRDRDCLVNEDEASDTPWGTGARTPIRRPSIDEATYELMCGRSHRQRESASLGLPHRAEDVVSGSASLAHKVMSLGLRGALLCALGLGYGVIVARLHSEQNHLPPLLDDSIMKPGHHWRYVVFWGLGGLVLGSLLPWFDTVWANVFERGSMEAVAGKDKDNGPGTDWALVMRAVGAFVGIVFAMVSSSRQYTPSLPGVHGLTRAPAMKRKLAWASTLQVSATLTLVNPLLWWLIDRSTSGFVLSTAVGLTGSLLLVGVKPELVPAPSASLNRNASAGFGNEPFALGGLARHETIETAMYLLSVLFCSCLFFGNIGRRLTWNRSSGRWGGIR
ncbi:hypothetical protein E4U42_005595 [Claviceps africana]|uniref:Uncharacterized protein n=1 Tax=Claviceps africana TaxID=83212 RepID=A0A8K0J3N7_9HYPO|nr:hypothetical protein E4U42_005595 [Claviceps africana]